jgi:DNA-directed RNA polymerase specialized sigma subunit
MILTKEKKEKQVIDLYFNEKKPYRYISQILRMSLRDIST